MTEIVHDFSGIDNWFDIKIICGRKPIKTNIEYSQRKDGSISVIISGKAAAVTEAKKQVLANLTQQGNYFEITH